MNTSKRHNLAARGTPARNRFYAGVFTALLAIGATAPVHAQRSDAPQEYSIQAGSLDDALIQLAKQNKLQIAYSPDLVKGKTASGLSGRHTWRAALQQLLRGTGLEWGMVNDSMVVIRKAPTKPERAKPKPRAEPAAQEEEVTNMPAIMVTGTKTLNMDIVRTEDDPQPYVVFDREQIERSGATSLEQFLQQRLTMNSSTINSGATGVPTSEISLRGLGAAQTLILLDGHRVSSPALSKAGLGSLNQAEITGIPLSAIDRIEVLPTTASGIYGGSATGGVINIIMRRDYAGAELSYTYENSTDSDTASQDINLVVGHGFNDGKTNLLITANYSDANDLLVGDRKFSRQNRDATWNNNPAWYLPPRFPPLGATPNISSSDGSNLVLKNGAPLDSSFTSVPAGYAGPSTDGGAALIPGAGTFNFDLSNTAQSDLQSGGSARHVLYSKPTVKSGGFVLRHAFSERTLVFIDAMLSKSVNAATRSAVSAIYSIPSTSPNNPFVQDIRVAIPLSGGSSELRTSIEHDRVIVGAVQEILKGWKLGADYTWDRTTVTSSGGLDAPLISSAINSGAIIDLLRDTNSFPVDINSYLAESGRTSPFESTMKDINLRASGPIWQFPGGAAVLSTALERRDESVGDSFNYLPAYGYTFVYPSREQVVNSAYLELRVPVFSDKNAKPWLDELEVQVAVRRDQYESSSAEALFLLGEVPSPLPGARRSRNKFSSVDPTLAVLWKPLSSMALRASYGTGFLPPSLNQLVPNISPSPVSFGTLDPLRGNTPAGPFTYITGGNANLDPESSKSISAGFVLTPVWAPGFRLSVDYTKIEKTDNVGFLSTALGSLQEIINNETTFSGRVTRGPRLPNDPPGWAGPITTVDNSAINLAAAKLEAWDVQLDLNKEVGRFGTLEFFLVGTWQPHYETQAISTLPLMDNAGIGHSGSGYYPLKFKASSGITWRMDSWDFGWNIQHFDSYLVSRSESERLSLGGDGRVSSQTYHDLFFKYDLGMTADSWLSGFDVQVGIKNIFNKKPPLDTANTSGFYSPFADPRIRSWYVTLNATF